MLFFPTADEDFKFFRSQGYTGSINDMHYKAMGDLGYTGSLNDRIHAYLTATYGSFYEAMRDLRNGTSVLALVGYRVLGLNPDLVFDFKQNYYRKGGTATTLSPAVTHTRAGQATMVDSDGLLKWAPHNLLRYSEQFNSWFIDGASPRGSVVANTTQAPDGTTTADSFSDSTASSYCMLFSVSIATSDSFGVYLKANTITEVGIKSRSGGVNNNDFTFINLTTGAVSATGTNMTGVTVTSVGNGWFFVTGTLVNKSYLGFSASDGSQNVVFEGNGSTFFLWGAHTFRSDLGGMVNNPAQPAGFETYVPTASSAVYLPRVGHHVYNGSTWVNEGILHESEARTNLLLNSGTLSTQNVTVSATLNTLSFTGTGRVTLTGVSTAGPLIGTGTGENNRVKLTFTPTAGTLTLTVSGTVTNAQLEAGSTPSSYIPTNGSTATRAAETLTVPAANLPYSSTNMSIQMDGKMTGNNLTHIRWFEDADDAILLETGTNNFTFTQEAGGTVDTVTGGSFTSGNLLAFNTASRHGSGFINGAISGTALTVNTTPSALPDLADNNLVLGYDFMGTIAQFRMWDEDLTDSGIAEAST